MSESATPAYITSLIRHFEDLRGRDAQRPIRCCSSRRLSRNFPFRSNAYKPIAAANSLPYAFQEKLMEYGIKFRPLKPASPHLNGKVERSQRTDLEKFYATVDLRAEDLAERLDDWQAHYNEFRVHRSLDGRTPWQVWYERAPDSVV